MDQGRIVDQTGRNLMLDFWEGDCFVSRIINNGRWSTTPHFSYGSTLGWDQIKEIELPVQGTDDKIVWSKEPSGNFTLKSGWNLIRDRKKRVDWVKPLLPLVVKEEVLALKLEALATVPSHPSDRCQFC
jgi:hypothetical protein